MNQKIDNAEEGRGAEESGALQQGSLISSQAHPQRLKIKSGTTDFADYTDGPRLTHCMGPPVAASGGTGIEPMLKSIPNPETGSPVSSAPRQSSAFIPSFQARKAGRLLLGLLPSAANRLGLPPGA